MGDRLLKPPNELAMLCSVCQGISFKPWLDLSREERRIILRNRNLFNENDEDDPENEDAYQDIEGDFNGSQLFIHHSGLKSLQESADNGCQFCYQLRYGVLENALDAEGDYDHVYLELEMWQIPSKPKEQLDRHVLRVYYVNHEGGIRLRERNEDFVNSAMAEYDFGSISTTGSVINLNLAAKWLCDCINHHTECPRELQSQSILPLRVLDIGLDKNSSRLHLSVGENRLGSYAALSYCWGEAAQVPLYVTTDDNIEARKKHIDAAILPKTFTDTINVCRHLGIRFLWIDSICIIQGNEDDWRTQAAQMGNIYSKAKLTIAAAAGTNSDSGLFVDRDPRKTYPCPFTARYINERGSVTTASFLSCRDLEEDKTGPLDSRGWAFQEMYLSARTLRFSAKGMHWVCASQNASEGLPMGQQPFNHKSDFDEFVNAGSYPSNSSPLDTPEKYVWWYKAVQLYNKRCFSKDSDRLIALSGLASILQEELQDEYLFGLWKGNFLQGLAWFVDSQAQELRPNKSSSMIAPSWSWASRAGKPIFYEAPSFSFGEETVRGVKSMCTIVEARNHIQHPLFEFLEGHPTLPNIYSKSSVIGSSLRIRGLVLRVWHRNSNLYAKIYDRTVSRSVPYNAGNSYLGEAEYDEPVDQDDILHCLPISFSSPPDRWTVTRRTSIMELFNIESKSRLESTPKSGVNIWCGSNDPGIMLEGGDVVKCLILKKTGKIKQYRRVGYVELSGAENFGEVKPVELEIV